ncbi:MAG: hypothetical protein ABSH32_25560 [Bryobacteraceae bacterium]|jgi:hypothetical protein
MDKTILEAALIGFQHRVEGVKAAIAAVKERLGEGNTPPVEKPARG